MIAGAGEGALLKIDRERSALVKVQKDSNRLIG